MRLRILLEPNGGASYAQILALARAAEEAGFDAFFRSDHYLGVGDDDVNYKPTDSWTTLAGLAVQTERVRIGTLVNASTFRLPGQLAVEVATVDQMSGGRAELGIGTAWFEREHQYFGIPFPKLAERFERLEEQLEILKGIWDTTPGERFSFEGKYYTVADCAAFPRWASRPKVIIGGGGPSKTPRLAAKYADEFNAALCPIDEHKARFDNFHRKCEEVGRDLPAARLSATVPVALGTDEADLGRRMTAFGQAAGLVESAGVKGYGPGGARKIRDVLQRLEEQGTDTTYFHVYGPSDVDHIHLLGSEVAARMLTPPAGACPAVPRP
jgi:F420-dependent oxidoreductase-like protein